MAARKLGGAFVLSSEDAARLLSVTVRESANGLSVSPNFIQESHAVLRSLRERPTGAGNFADTFNTTQFPRFQQGGSRASVTAAWAVSVPLHGVVRPINVAVIDAGFWLNAAGQPLPLATAGGTDLPATPIQYDFVGDDFIAGASNPASCGGGVSCSMARQRECERRGRTVKQQRGRRRHGRYRRECLALPFRYSRQSAARSRSENCGQPGEPTSFP